MVSCSKSGLNPYGLLLTKVFKHLKFNVSIPPFFHVINTISKKAFKSIIPLNIFTPTENELPTPAEELPENEPPASVSAPQRMVPINLSITLEKYHAMILDLEHLKAENASLKATIAIILSNNDKTISKLESLQPLLNNALARLTLLETSLAQLIFVHISLQNNPNTSSDIFFGVPVYNSNHRTSELIEMSPSNHSIPVVNSAPDLDLHPVDPISGNMDLDLPPVVDNSEYNKVD